MKYCKECGFPAPYGKFLEWTSDGTILGNDEMRTRLVYLDVDELSHLFNGISKWVERPIDKIICQAEKTVGRRFVETLLPGFLTKIPKGRFARPEPGAKLVGNYMFNYMGGLGMGRAVILQYQSGKYAKVKITNGHSIALIAGDGAGVFEYLERIRVHISWVKAGSEQYILELTKSGDEAEKETEIQPAKEYVKGNAELEKCPSCGVPLLITRNIYLNLEKGTLRHKITGVRVVALPVESFNAVMRALSREFGEELNDFVEGLERKYFRENFVPIKEDQGNKHEAIYSDFNWKGIGNPSGLVQTSTGLEVTVLNPFHPQAVAGRVAGIYEASTNTAVRSTANEISPGVLKVVMEPVSR
ncbi:MAG: hypothetical protein PHP64_06910 [Actinomycetota bacterium]|nr:hypothetical protein [Actinomycetota bacterium]